MVLLEGTLVQRMLEAFMMSHRTGWSEHTIEFYQSIFEAYYQEFPVTPGNATEVIRWIGLLKPAWKTVPLESKTRQNYYNRIRYLYRWAKENIDGAQDLPELSYESFAPRSKLRKSREE